MRSKLSFTVGTRKETPLIGNLLQVNDESVLEVCFREDNGCRSPWLLTDGIYLVASGTVTGSAGAVAVQYSEGFNFPAPSKRRMRLMRK